MARGNAERRLRESAMNSGRSRVQISTTGGVFERRMDVALWSGRAAAEDASSEPIHFDSVQSKSPDVELVEPEPVLVKQERVEPNMSRVEEREENVPLIRDDGVLECVPCGPVRPSLEQQDNKSTSCQTWSQIQSSRTRHAGSSRGVEKEEEPDVVLVKVEEVESVTGTQNQTGLSIQEGLVESSTDDCRAVLPFDEIPETSNNCLSDLQESGRGFSESAAPQPTPVISQEPSSMGAVQLRVPDTNTPANPKTHQQQRSNNNNPLSSEYSLFELETFFTRWAPDRDSAGSGPSCPFTTDNPAQSDQDEVIIEGQSFSSVQMQPSVSQGLSAEPSVSVPLRMQAPSSQPSWSRKPVMIRSSQAQLLQQHPDSNRISQQQHVIPSAQSARSSTTAAVIHTHSGDKTTTSGISSNIRTMSSVGGSTAGLASIEVAIAVQHRANLLARHNKSQAASMVPSECSRKRYICRACGKAFSGLSNLEAHERVHTGEKPFRCDTCGKRFSEAGNLKKHQRVHTGEKPFSCEKCGKRFAWICNLRTHQQSATGCGPQASGGLGLGC
ncbi:zinc finger and BTB domain-containing protein 49 [Etheostoma spectabile]|uniref:zinc finger and BTB domain-containing protein 49 n=1 Tax=Etheostoma spectabile TaxID=54343 RepID=UPI0013AFC75F|nr:zinc finger and BTB domain-containing protein 49-like [Etheostoma spectabile]